MNQTTTPTPCRHPECSDCGKSGKACGRSMIGDPGHETCTPDNQHQGSSS